jgi:hypothetical protein
MGIVERRMPVLVRISISDQAIVVIRDIVSLILLGLSWRTSLTLILDTVIIRVAILDRRAVISEESVKTGRQFNIT